MVREVTLNTKDGTGPELAAAARKCLNASGVKFNWDVQEAGVDVMEKTGTPIPDATMDSVRRTKCAQKAPNTTPVGTGFRSINVYLRQELGLFAYIRPCKQYQGVRSNFSELPVDLVIVRENTEDLYAGVRSEAPPRRPFRGRRARTGRSNLREDVVKPVATRSCWRTLYVHA